MQVEASVTQPERLRSYVTNTFNFEFSTELRRDGDGKLLPLPRILPTTGERRGAGCAIGQGVLWLEPCGNARWPRLVQSRLQERCRDGLGQARLRLDKVTHSNK